MYLPACLPAYCLTYLPVYLPACLPIDYVVYHGCLRMPCCVCCVGPHRDLIANAIQDKTNAQCAQRLLESVMNKNVLVEICRSYLQVPNITWVGMNFLHLCYDAYKLQCDTIVF